MRPLRRPDHGIGPRKGFPCVAIGLGFRFVVGGLGLIGFRVRVGEF